MDWVDVKNLGVDSFKKYRWVLFVLLSGIFLMTLPDGTEKKTEPTHTEAQSQPSLAVSLSNLLSQIDGAGMVEVLLTELSGSQTLYQTDEDRSAGETTTDIRRETILVTNASREETGLIRRIDPPTYQGAIVLCQGAENANVKLAIVEAVANATGLTTDKITVLKMK